MRLLLLCPGRGSYGKAQLGSLQGVSPTLDNLDAYRASLGRPTLRELDALERFSPRQHMAGEHASLLTFGATLADLEQLSPDKARVVAVTGNSMGWYTALYVAGALSLDQAARLVETLGSYQLNNVVGAQVLYPTSDADWRPDPTLQAHVQSALQLPGVYLSIDLGGTVVLGASKEALPALLKALPSFKAGVRNYPLQLPLHSAFHTPLLQPASDRAKRELADLPFSAPTRPLIGGDGQRHPTWACPEALRDYTLGAQVVQPYNLSLALSTALGEYAPDAVLLPGPGGNLGGTVGQVMIRLGWRGLRDRQDFLEAQGGDRPVVISMVWPDQRALVTD